MAGQPRKRSGKRCGAYARSTGKPCQCRMLFKGGKCKLHGGKSLNAKDMERITRKTGRIFKKRGPATPEGIARRNAGRVRYYAERRRLAASGSL